MSIVKQKVGSKLRIGIIGLGMVGSPIKRWFEELKGYRRGEELFCYDIDPKKKSQDDINKADVIFVAVPTPPAKDGSCDTSLINKAITMINDGKIVVIKSTIIPGTLECLQKKFPGKKFIFNPEFLTESQAWIDFIKPDRQILGSTSESFSDVKEVLAVLPKAHFERPWSSDYSKKSVNATEAELIKYAANVFGYIKVIYGNILADFCYGINKDFANEKIKVEINYENIREAISADPRIGPAWLNVNHGNYFGAGGYCFPKDMNAFIKFGDDLIKKLSKKSSGTDPNFVKNFKNGINVLRSLAIYNEGLIKWQGLSMDDVSKHNGQEILKKRRKVRV